MDAFAVSICKGLSMKKMNWKNAIIIGTYFGVFQAGMPILGFILGKSFEQKITSIDHWVAFILLGYIGVKMIKEAISEKEENVNDTVDVKTMLILAIATSIDALAVGITFAFFKVNILFAAVLIGMVTFLLSIFGVKLGNKFGDKYERKSEIAGGLILIFMGTKILLEHLGII
jgi:putative Mn2+ efflux pump MntP